MKKSKNWKNLKIIFRLESSDILCQECNVTEAIVSVKASDFVEQFNAFKRKHEDCKYNSAMNDMAKDLQRISNELEESEKINQDLAESYRLQLAQNESLEKLLDKNQRQMKSLVDEGEAYKKIVRAFEEDAKNYHRYFNALVEIRDENEGGKCIKGNILSIDGRKKEITVQSDIGLFVVPFDQVWPVKK